MTNQKSPMKTNDQSHAIVFGYTNYRGEYDLRTAIPHSLRWGTTEWHPEGGWLMKAWDVDKGAFREFALSDCDFTVKG